MSCHGVKAAPASRLRSGERGSCTVTHRRLRRKRTAAKSFNSRTSELATRRIWQPFENDLCDRPRSKIKESSQAFSSCPHSSGDTATHDWGNRAKAACIQGAEQRTKAMPKIRQPKKFSYQAFKFPSTNPVLLKKRLQCLQKLINFLRRKKNHPRANAYVPPDPTHKRSPAALGPAHRHIQDQEKDHPQ